MVFLRAYRDSQLGARSGGAWDVLWKPGCICKGSCFLVISQRAYPFEGILALPFRNREDEPSEVTERSKQCQLQPKPRPRGSGRQRW